MTLEAAIADLLALEGSGSDFTDDRVLSVVMGHVAGLGMETQAARLRLADEFERRAPATDRVTHILDIILSGETADEHPTRPRDPAQLP